MFGIRITCLRANDDIDKREFHYNLNQLEDLPDNLPVLGCLLDSQEYEKMVPSIA